MGTYCELYVADYPVFSSKSQASLSVMTLFRERDKRAFDRKCVERNQIEWGHADWDPTEVERVVEYTASVREVRDRLSYVRVRAEPRQRLQRRRETRRGGLPQLGIGETGPRRVAPQRVVRSGLGARALVERLDRAVRGLGGLRVVEQGRRHSERHQPPVVARLRVDHAEFEVPALQVWTLHDGKVSRMRYLVDTAKLLRAIEDDPVS